MATADEDKHLIDLVLAEEDKLTVGELAAFQRLRRLPRGLTLSVKQRAWLEKTAHRIGVVEPSRNMVSNGEVPKQKRHVELAEPLKRLPLRPPGKPQSWRER